MISSFRQSTAKPLAEFPDLSKGEGKCQNDQGCIIV